MSVLHFSYKIHVLNSEGTTDQDYRRVCTHTPFGTILMLGLYPWYSIMQAYHWSPFRSAPSVATVAVAVATPAFSFGLNVVSFLNLFVTPASNFKMCCATTL